ncbi:MAG: 2,3-diaminopropionate biosynthesis protein SbnB [Bacteroidota bacterium]
MVTLNESDILSLGIDWDGIVSALEEAVKCLDTGDYSQPIKPYLRYRNPKNRIIAMPAFVGGNINMSGIKWIASFPENIDQGIPRAHSVTILNEADTGIPLASINTTLQSIIRTAGVTGVMIKHFLELRNPDKVKIGMTGFGPIGQYHALMCKALLGDRIEKISVYDLRTVDPSTAGDAEPLIEVVDSWQEAYEDADIFITCTVSSAPYVDLAPKAGSLHLNVSLRDYTTTAADWFKGAIIVDDWDEVNREKTDIEMMHLEKGLQKEGTMSIADVIVHNRLANLPAEAPIMFNPMGMAIFDIAVGCHYYQKQLSFA